MAQMMVKPALPGAKVEKDGVKGRYYKADGEMVEATAAVYRLIKLGDLVQCEAKPATKPKKENLGDNEQ